MRAARIMAQHAAKLLETPLVKPLPQRATKPASTTPSLHSTGAQTHRAKTIFRPPKSSQKRAKRNAGMNSSGKEMAGLRGMWTRMEGIATKSAALRIVHGAFLLMGNYALLLLVSEAPI